MAYSQNPRTPLAKALKGNQNKLPDHLKAKIESARETPLQKRGDAPSRKKSKGYYNEVRSKSKEGAAAGGGMTELKNAKIRTKMGIVQMILLEETGNANGIKRARRLDRKIY